MRESQPAGLRATYRVQLHAQFTLRDAAAIVPWLESLGVSHLYTSPLTVARLGSRHGYDVVDPHRINPELGNEEDLSRLAEALHERGMGLLVDIVPNHMATGPENRYWEDVLSHGERSRYSKWFDVSWDMHTDRRLVLPILNDDLRLVLERGELKVRVTEAGARLVYFQMSVPISADSAPESLQLAQWDPAAAADAQARFNGPEAASHLSDLLDAQHYRLMDWRKALREINYRRFFDVNDLVGLRIEDPTVFSETHEMTLALVAKGVIDGLRVDHIDGLRDPEGYLRRLHDACAAGRGAGFPILVEKILMRDERLRDRWPVEGTTGYERLNDIEELFVDPKGFARIEQRYRTLRRRPGLTFEGTVRADKRAVLDRAFAAEVLRLARLLDQIVALRGDKKQKFTREQIFHGIEEFVGWFPVYRSYIAVGAPLHPDDAAALASVAAASGTEDTVAGLIRRLLSGEESVRDDALLREFIERLQQLTGPAMAKGLEDTAHYGYVPLASRNEVGGAPDRSLDGVIDRFHRVNADYAANWPGSLVATTTHDTKRSGDVRARIAAISEFPADWDRSFTRWRRLNRKHQRVVRGRVVPDVNAEWLAYQTLVGVWPSPRAGRRADDIPDRAWRGAALERLKTYMLKAVREAKLRTSWTDPDREYEEALVAFLAAVMNGGDDDPFLSDVSRFVSSIATAASWNALSRVLLHLTIPGVPDLYQGDELWNFTLVDPDNRRPVDYDARRAALDAVGKLPPCIEPEAVVAHPLAKLIVAHRVLAFRRANSGLFAGGYRVLPAPEGVVMFERSAGDNRCIVVAPRLTGRNAGGISLPGGLRCVITGGQSGDMDRIRFGLFVER